MRKRFRFKLKDEKSSKMLKISCHVTLWRHKVKIISFTNGAYHVSWYKYKPKCTKLRYLKPHLSKKNWLYLFLKDKNRQKCLKSAVTWPCDVTRSKKYFLQMVPNMSYDISVNIFVLNLCIWNYVKSKKNDVGNFFTQALTILSIKRKTPLLIGKMNYHG